MPYIAQYRREFLDPDGVSPQSVGELNFLFTLLAYRFWKENGANYSAINDVLGALEGAKLEFYRRVAAPYEDKKIKENGDVYV